MGIVITKSKRQKTLNSIKSTLKPKNPLGMAFSSSKVKKTIPSVQNPHKKKPKKKPKTQKKTKEKNKISGT